MQIEVTIREINPLRKLVKYNRPNPLKYEDIPPNYLQRWFGDRNGNLIGSDDDRKRAWLWLQKFIRETFDVELYRSPGLTGLYCIHRTLPVCKETGKPYSYHPIPNNLYHIFGFSPQHHVELFQYKSAGKPVYGYDGRVMYLACLREVPCLHHPDDLVHDNQNEFAGKYWSARYRCRVRIPERWNHIGLVAAPDTDSQTTWLWPREPGFEFETWMTNTEVSLLMDVGWDVSILERILFSEKNSDPLRTFSEKMTRLLTSIDQKIKEQRTPSLLALRSAARAIVLQAVGLMHQPRSELEEINLESEQLNRAYKDIYLGDDGVMRAVVYGSEKSPWWASWSRYEWSTSIWAKARVRTARKILQIPFDSLIAINGDAFYTTANPGWEETGKIGEHRLTEGPVLLKAGTTFHSYLEFKDALSGKR